ncbi:MAG TPA: hypothetical protein VGH14_03750 [Solirubrobacterales bacterium]|jgi:hypothetical protein
MMPLAHIAGIPVEETALSFGPVLVAGGGIASWKVRQWLGRGPVDEEPDERSQLVHDERDPGR